MTGRGKMKYLNEKNILILIFIIALVLRLIAIMNIPIYYQIPGEDTAEYDEIAVNLLTGKGFIMKTNIAKEFIIDSKDGLPTSWRSPLYPIFLALIYAIFGHSYFAVRVIQSIMGALLCIIIFYISKKLFNGKIALLSAAMLAFYQPVIFYLHWGGPVFLFSENLFLFLLALLVSFLVRNFFVQCNLKNSIISGILIGLLSLTRPIFALFPLVLFGLLLIHQNKFPFIIAIKKISLLIIGFLLVILPWTARNYFVHKAFVPFTTEGGYVLFSGNNPNANGGGITRLAGFLTEEERSQIGKMSEVQRDNMYRRHAKDFWFKNYKKLPRLFFKKALVLWDVFRTEYDQYSNNMTRRYDIWFSIILMFGLFGIVKTIKSKLDINSLLLISLFFYFTVMALIFCGEPRFRQPVEPYLIIFASVGIFAIYDNFKNKFLSYAIISIIIGINLLIYIYSDVVLNWIRYPLRFLGI